MSTSGAFEGTDVITVFWSRGYQIVLAEDQYLVREGLRRCSRHRTGSRSSPCAGIGSLLAQVDAERPDVVVTDIRMPPGNLDEGIQAASRLRETNPEVGVVV